MYIQTVNDQGTYNLETPWREVQKIHREQSLRCTRKQPAQMKKNR